MMLLRNDLFHYPESGKIFRLLWIHPESAGAFVIDINNKNAQPALVSTNELIDDINYGRACLLETDPLAISIKEEFISKKRIVARNRAWRVIENLVDMVPDIYRSHKRGAFVKQICAEHGVTHPTVYKYLRRYWQRGQTANALLPNYDKSGGKGRSRISQSGIKRGRPRKYDPNEGINVTESILSIFRVATQRYYIKNRKHSLSGAFQEMLRDFFFERKIDRETGEVIHILLASASQEGIPTEVQYRYWFEKEINTFDIKRRRVGEKIYDKDMRGFVGTSNAEVWGPGARYQIDATIADVYLVSRLERNRIIGRPVLYVVIDVFSRMIVGFYVGLEGPSWVGAMMALANTTTDKTAYCKRFGFDITQEDWPCHHLPATLLGDRGEIEGHYIETLANNYRVTIENTAPYRADWKGIVEKRFHLLPAKYKPYIPGYVEPDFRQRGARDYRLDAVLDLDQFTEIIIADILYYNNHHELKEYDRDKEIAADGVLPVPVELWEWGINNRSGCLRTYPSDGVRFHLLPTEKATVTEMGIRYGGSYYICNKALEERWLDRARQRGKWSVGISYDPRDRDIIYLHDEKEPNGFLFCTLTERSRVDRNLSEWEIGQRQFSEKTRSAKHETKQKLAAANLSTRINQVVKKAVSQQTDSTLSDRARTNRIRENRKEERTLIGEREAFRLGEQAVRQEGSAKIIPINPSLSDAYSEPDITEILFKLSDDGKRSKDDK